MINYGDPKKLYPNLNSYWIKKAFYTFHNTPFHLVDDAPNETALIEWTKTHTLGKDSMPIWSGGSENTIYTTRHDNYVFRAWHDTLHLKHGLGFNYRDELEVGVKHMEELELIKAPLSVIKAVEYDTIGQVEYYNKYKQFVDNQREFVANCLAKGIIDLCMNY